MKESTSCWTSGLAVKKLITELPNPESSDILQQEQNLSGLFDTELPTYDMMDIEDMDAINCMPTNAMYKEEDDCLSSFLDLNDFLKATGNKDDNGMLSVLPQDEISLTSFSDIAALLDNAATDLTSTENNIPTDILSLAAADILEPTPTQNREATNVETLNFSNSESFNFNIIDSSESQVIEIPSVAAEALTSDHDYVKVKAHKEEEEEEEVIKKRPSANKYRERRVKNNIASKRSREIRKQKHSVLEEQAEHLVKENARLQEQIVQLEALTKEMKASLIQKMTGK